MCFNVCTVFCLFVVRSENDDRKSQDVQQLTVGASPSTGVERCVILVGLHGVSDDDTNSDDDFANSDV